MIGIFDKDGRCRFVEDDGPSFIGKVLVQECGMTPRLIETNGDCGAQQR